MEAKQIIRRVITEIDEMLDSDELRVPTPIGVRLEALKYELLDALEELVS